MIGKGVIERVFVPGMVSMNYLLLPLLMCILQFCWICLLPL